MSIEISQEIETRLASEALRQGVSVDALLERLLGEMPVHIAANEVRRELPILHLGDIGPLHRRDIYEDER